MEPKQPELILPPGSLLEVTEARVVLPCYREVSVNFQEPVYALFVGRVDRFSHLAKVLDREVDDEEDDAPIDTRRASVPSVFRCARTEVLTAWGMDDLLMQNLQKQAHLDGVQQGREEQRAQTVSTAKHLAYRLLNMDIGASIWSDATWKQMQHIFLELGVSDIKAASEEVAAQLAAATTATNE